MRWVSTRVLPEPAPARIKRGPSTCSTAACWAGLRCRGLFMGYPSAKRNHVVRLECQCTWVTPRDTRNIGSRAHRSSLLASASAPPYILSDEQHGTEAADPLPIARPGVG